MFARLENLATQTFYLLFLIIKIFVILKNKYSRLSVFENEEKNYIF